MSSVQTKVTGVHTAFLVGGEKFVGHCHSTMHEYETIQFWGGGMKPRRRLYTCKTYLPPFQHIYTLSPCMYVLHRAFTVYYEHVSNVYVHIYCNT